MRQSYPHHLQPSIILFVSLVNTGVGYCGGNASSTGAGAVGICYVLLLMTQTLDPWRRENRSNQTVADIARPTAQPAVDIASLDDPVEQMLGQSRYALLLRTQVVGSLTEEQFHRAIGALRQGMAFVPEGDVEVYAGTVSVADEFSGDTAGQSHTGRVFHLEPFFLDRWPVTNGEYYEFVAAGGYREIELWDSKIWTAVLDMVDQTGMPGPRFWRNGHYLPGEEELPVVGISWYEASACTRWLCKRLPTDSEWVKAASWPVPINAESLAHRRYPWGDAMDRTGQYLGFGPQLHCPRPGVCRGRQHRRHLPVDRKCLGVD